VTVEFVGPRGSDTLRSRRKIGPGPALSGSAAFRRRSPVDVGLVGIVHQLGGRVPIGRTGRRSVDPADPQSADHAALAPAAGGLEINLLVLLLGRLVILTAAAASTPEQLGEDSHGSIASGGYLELTMTRAMGLFNDDNRAVFTADKDVRDGYQYASTPH
jgi:hypothetical protein